MIWRKKDEEKQEVYGIRFCIDGTLKNFEPPYHLVTSSRHSAEDPSLLAKGYECTAYDSRENEWIYEKEAGEEAIESVCFLMHVRTTESEKESYGLEKEYMNSMIDCPVPAALLPKITAYISKVRKQDWEMLLKRKDDPELFDVLLSCYGEEMLFAKEAAVMKEFHDDLSESLRKEYLHQLATDQSAECVMDVYRSVFRKYSSQFCHSGYVTYHSRPYEMADRVLGLYVVDDEKGKPVLKENRGEKV